MFPISVDDTVSERDIVCPASMLGIWFRGFSLACLVVQNAETAHRAFVMYGPRVVLQEELMYIDHERKARAILYEAKPSVAHLKTGCKQRSNGSHGTPWARREAALFVDLRPRLSSPLFPKATAVDDHHSSPSVYQTLPPAFCSPLPHRRRVWSFEIE